MIVSERREPDLLNALNLLPLKADEAVTVEKEAKTAVGLPRDKREIEELIGRRLRAEYRVETLREEAKRISAALEVLEKRGAPCSLLAYGDPGYPALLGEIYDPPYMLYCRGDAGCLNDPITAVVGSRAASGEGEHDAFCVGCGVGLAGESLVSGLARGIDAAAMYGALAGGSASSGKGTHTGKGAVIAVFGCGIDRIYPPENRALAGQIIERGGALVSEFPPGEPPRRHNFPRRNRIISGLASRLVVIDAAQKSGALITADFALDQGRDIFVIGDSPGCGKLAEEGAEQYESAAELLCAWGWPVAESVEVMSLKEEALAMDKGEEVGLVRFKERVYKV